MTRSCGGCAACCTHIGVLAWEPEHDFDKPSFTPCHLCTGCGLTGSCSVYERRPQSCRDYSCAWLVNPDWPDDMRPDKTGVVWELNSDAMGVALGTCETAALLDAPLTQAFMRFLLGRGISILVHTRDHQIHAALAPGHTEEWIIGRLLHAAIANHDRTYAARSADPSR